MNLNSSLYEQDYYLWLEKTAYLLENRQFTELDLENLVDEILDMSRSEKKSLKSNLIVLLQHLLKYRYQPTKRTKSWRLTIEEHRYRIKEGLQDSPSLKPFFQEVLNECYQQAKKRASIETKLSIDAFPDESPFTIEQILDSDYLPE
ncbi:DUF29 domain-containing protein [Aphanothece hegewaldii CCALA 016]|uniref:DUF29 domain-containing protein n=1 Tax=Aphanothece hegewaldii CCALA 016 TaxID=2107694 RepID=A0A2T1LW85_9CHRO|nr:DUF29 domain-containing protein [Aphanothece hegewaldii]PSF36159.1 DUF29 domain-containing protein [Aphanothece hegewaldii CCALA 016]